MRPGGRRATGGLCIIALGVLSAGCEKVEQVQDSFRDLTPYEAYEALLADAGLLETALGRDWVAAGTAALQNPLTVTLPFSEAGFVTADRPDAMAYRIDLPRGRRLTAEVTLATGDSTRVFVDLFRVAADEGDPLRPVLSSDSVPSTFVYEPWRGGEYILRLQPELLRGGQYTVTLTLEAQLAFPVEGRDMQAIQSRFGAERDGGARSHEGVDIFARRGTPVLAASAGWAYRIGITSLGGKVVWVRDPVRNARVYYAHLDSQVVKNGDRIEIGDTLGFVGNTGNARTTPPHLHFGLYRSGEGAIDPLPFLDPPRGVLTELTVDVARLGSWVRMGAQGSSLRAGPADDAERLRELPLHTALRVLGASADHYRVRLPDGSVGYVAARLVEPMDQPLAAQLAVSGAALFARPVAEAPLVALLDREAELPVLARYDDFVYVEAPGGTRGWLSAPPAVLPGGVASTEE